MGGGCAHQLWLRMASSLPFVVVCCGPVPSCGCALPPPWAVRVVGLFVTSCGCARVLLARCGFGTGSPVVVAHVASLLRDMGAGMCSPVVVAHDVLSCICGQVPGSGHQLWLRIAASLRAVRVLGRALTSCGCARVLLSRGRSGRAASPVVVAHEGLLCGPGDGWGCLTSCGCARSSPRSVPSGRYGGFTSCGCARLSPPP